MQNSDKKYREGESRKKNSMNVHLKMGGKKRLTQLCVFGYKVGWTIFTAFHPPIPNQTHKLICFLFVLTKKVEKKEK